LFQFVESARGAERSQVVAQQWLDDGSLHLFGGDRLKHKLFHRVQRVDRRSGHRLPPAVPGFETRRVNFTFRFMPDAHVVPFARLGSDARHDVAGYVEELARRSPFYAAALADAVSDPASRPGSPSTPS
jgi:hypothetical protein